MDNVIGNLTVFFDNPFWVAVFELASDGKLSVCKVTFGAEPKDYEVYDFILKKYNDLHFSSPIETQIRKESKNPKRMQRDIKKCMQTSGIGTKAQQALQLQRESYKKERHEKTKLEKEERKLLLFNLRQQKKKEKKKGH